MRNSYNASGPIPGISILAAVVILSLCFMAISCSRSEETKVFTVGQNVTPPLALERPLPPYTEEAKQAHAEGIVILQGIVRKSGLIDSLKVIKKLGYGLDESAMNTIAGRWRFKPGTYKGAPVDVQANFEVAFKLY